MGMRIRTLLKWLIVCLAVFWVALTYSKIGVLVSGGAKAIEPIDTGKQSSMLVCKYFNGLGFVVKDYWSAKPGGNERCPMVIDLRSN